MSQRFLLIRENGPDTSVEITHEPEPIWHFDNRDAAFNFANRRAAEDGASVLLRSNNHHGGAFWLDITEAALLSKSKPSGG